MCVAFILCRSTFQTRGVGDCAGDRGTGDASLQKASGKGVTSRKSRQLSTYSDNILFQVLHNVEQYLCL